MDPYEYRKDFPLFEEEEGGIVYFDNACMTLRPKQVIDKIVEYYSEYPGCGGRSLHRISSSLYSVAMLGGRSSRAFSSMFNCMRERIPTISMGSFATSL